VNEKDRTPRIHELFLYLCVADAPAAIDFYMRVFGAEQTLRLQEPGGRVGHAELRIGPATVMLCDEHPELGIRSPRAFGGTGAAVHLHVDDVDRLARRAVEAGAEMVREPTDYAHGERQCRIRDPFGHEWLLGHSLEDVSDEEIARRFDAEHGEARDAGSAPEPGLNT
jgi:PhnB protein